MNIEDLGFDAHFEEAFRLIRDSHVPARVSFASRDAFRVQTENGEFPAVLAGKLRFQDQHVTVGDWVAVKIGPDDNLPVISHLLPRKNLVSRTGSGTRKNEGVHGSGAQHLCANVDSLLIVCGLDRDYNLKRIERYAALAYCSSAAPVVVLNKADKAPDGEERSWEVMGALPGVEVIHLSALTGENFGRLGKLLLPGMTAALLGSSGAGKSTILNRLLGEEKLKTGEVSSAVGKGRHTTTHRELFLLPTGAVVIDNPGLREIALTSSGEMGELFSVIEECAKGCRFRDCTHEGEPGCAVQEAVKKGSFDEERLASYRKLGKEVLHAKKRTQMSAAAIEREKWKPIKKLQRKM